jgi:hypothetical protein
MKSTWTRGHVKKKYSDGKCLVFLPDIGAELPVSQSQIKYQPPRLRSVAPLAVPCFLKDVSPLPGDERWSNKAVTDVKSVLNLHGLS